MNAQSREPDKFMIRLPDGLRDAIKIEAAKNRRSMNAEVVVLLEREFAPHTNSASQNGEQS